MEVSANTTAAQTGDNDSSATSATSYGYGLTGLLIFIIVIIIIIVIRKKLNQKVYNLEMEAVEGHQFSDGYTARSSGLIDDVIRRWVGDSQLAKATRDVLIDVKHLTIGRKLGSGESM